VLFKLTLTFFVILYSTFSVFPYEQMMRHGYNSCIACHQSPTGGGSLNAYGKVISNSLSHFQKSVERGTLRKKMSFNDKIDYALQTRIAHFRTKDRTRTFPMQFDALIHAQVSKKLSSSLVIAKAPRQSDDTESKISDEIYVRRLLVHLKDKKTIWEFGRDYHNIGFRQVDHTVYNRSFHRNSIEDLPTQARVTHYLGKHAIQAYVFTHSFQEKDKESGFFIKEEYAPRGLNISLYGLYGKSSLIKRFLIGSTFKFPILKSLLFMLENNFSKREIIKDRVTFTNWTGLAQLSFFPQDFIELYLRLEKATRQNPFKIRNTKKVIGFDYKATKTTSLQLQYRDETTLALREKSLMTQLFFNWW